MYNSNSPIAKNNTQGAYRSETFHFGPYGKRDLTSLPCILRDRDSHTASLFQSTVLPITASSGSYLRSLLGAPVSPRRKEGLKWGITLVILASVFVSSPANAEPDYTRLVDAIYKAEGGSHTRHPYGILTKYKNTSPRQACLNTCRNQYKRHLNHKCGKDYLTCLRDRYAPLSASNDPRKLNHNWLNNVRVIYEGSRTNKV